MFTTVLHDSHYIHWLQVVTFTAKSSDSLCIVSIVAQHFATVILIVLVITSKGTACIPNLHKN